MFRLSLDSLINIIKSKTGCMYSGGSNRIIKRKSKLIFKRFFIPRVPDDMDQENRRFSQAQYFINFVILYGEV